MKREIDKEETIIKFNNEFKQKKKEKVIVIICLPFSHTPWN